MVNKVILTGNLGADPEIKAMDSGDKVCNLSLATSDSWKDKTTGEKKTVTEWHRVVIWNQGLVGVMEKYAKKGMKLYVEGELKTRSFEQDGVKKYTTEVVLRNFNSIVEMLSQASEGGASDGAAPSPATASEVVDDDEDEIPF